jgi:hypothetical protein
VLDGILSVLAAHKPMDRAESQYGCGELEEALPQTFCFRVSATGMEGSIVEGCVLKGRHFDRSVILPCLRWYPTYSLRL